MSTESIMAVEKANNLFPRGEIIRQLDSALNQLVDFLNTNNPDLIITTGDSGLISRVLVQELAKRRNKKTPILRLNQEINTIMYKHIYPNLTEAERLKFLTHEIATWKKAYPQLNQSTKIIFIDEYIDTGAKAISMLVRMHQLGFNQVRFAVFAGPTKTPKLVYTDDSVLNDYFDQERPVFNLAQASQLLRDFKIDWQTDIFIAEKEPKLLDYLIDLAKTVRHERQVLSDKQKREEQYGNRAKYVSQAIANTLRGIKTFTRLLGHKSTK